MTLRIETASIATFSITIKRDTQHNGSVDVQNVIMLSVTYAACQYAECYYADCHGTNFIVACFLSSFNYLLFIKNVLTLAISVLKHI